MQGRRWSLTRAGTLSLLDLTPNRTPDTSSEVFWTDFLRALDAIGQTATLPTGETQLNLPAPARRRIMLLHQDRRPFAMSVCRFRSISTTRTIVEHKRSERWRAYQGSNRIGFPAKQDDILRTASRHGGIAVSIALRRSRRVLN